MDGKCDFWDCRIVIPNFSVEFEFGKSAVVSILLAFQILFYRDC
jgi:hypothetical protein